MVYLFFAVPFVIHFQFVVHSFYASSLSYVIEDDHFFKKGEISRSKTSAVALVRRILNERCFTVLDYVGHHSLY